MSQSRIIILALSLTLAGIAGVVAVGWAFYKFAVKGTSSGPPTDAEKRLVLDDDAIAKFTHSFDPKCQSLNATRLFDGSIQIEHRYECGSLRVISAAEVARTTGSAVQSYAIMLTGFKGGVRIGGGSLDPQQQLLALGDQHYAATVRKDGQIVGNAFVLRQGRVVHSLLMTGVYVDDPEFVHDLFAPLIEESKKYR